MDTLLKICILIYDFALIAGAAYLVQEHNWSMWVFLLVAVFFMTSKTKEKTSEQ